MKKLIIIVIVLVSIKIEAQLVLPEQVIAKFDRGNMYLRWEPQSIEEWKLSVSSGYVVEQYIKSGVSEKLISVQKIKPASKEEWRQLLSKLSGNKLDKYEGARNLLYPDESQGSLENVLNSLKKKSTSTVDSFRLSFLSYTINHGFDIAVNAGLGAKFSAIQNENYVFKIYVPSLKPMVKEIISKEKDYGIPQLSAEFDNKKVNLNWNSQVFRNYYFGYIIEKSIDGLKYKVIDSTPYVNTLDKYKDKPALHRIAVDDSLQRNYETTYYRIRGMDYFGDMHKEVSTIKGYGFDKLTVSPALILAEQMDDNKAHLKWEMKFSKDDLIKDFKVLRADSIDGKYTVAMDSIAADSREVYVPMEFESNFFRVEVNPKDGKPLSSMPIFVMGMDTMPPAKPEIISGLIDSLGRVRLTWKKNKESDLWGYRVFTANFDDEKEFALLRAAPSLDTFFVDTVNLNFETDKVYYKIVAADQRNNRSPFSETFIIQKPDKVPPGMPSISAIAQKGDSIVIKWLPSISRDVVKHQLFKRKINEEEGWHLMAEFDSTHYNVGKILSHNAPYFTLIDTNVVNKGLYAYTMLAIDEAKLQSKSMQPKIIEVKEIKKKFLPFKSVNYVIDSTNNHVLLKWEANNVEKLLSVVIYKGPDKNKMGHYAEVDGKAIEFNEPVDKKEKVYYCLVPQYSDNNDFMASEVIEVLPNNKGLKR